MREKGVGGLPVMDTSGAKAIGNISIRDVQYLLTAPKIYKEHRFVVLIHPLLIGHVYDKKYKKKKTSITAVIAHHAHFTCIVGTMKTIATDTHMNC
jgi:CBS domain-containing protein